MNFDIISRDLSPEKAGKFGKYYEMLTEWNKMMNLTAITEPDEVALKHFADSLTVMKYIDPSKPATLADVGSGAGFPGIPLKIMMPDLEVTLIDSLGKRVRFLEAVIGELKLDGIRAIHARAEDAARKKQLREQFDYATARAVAPMNILTEYCMPFVKTGGCFIAMKGPGEERYENALKELNGEVISDELFALDSEGTITRRIICIRKTAPVSGKYPRRAGIPSSKPL